ncbi:MAG: MarR family transcriptional regulator [Anaerocolumna sp.]
MDKTITHDFLLIINNLRKLTNMNHHKDMVHQGEFMMLGAIHNCMEEKRENNIDEPGIKVSELSCIVHSTKPATSKMLRALEEKNYIERISDKKDRRIVYIRLSVIGEKKLKEAFNRKHLFADRMIKRMGEEDAKELIHMLNKFYDAMNEELKEKSLDTKETMDHESEQKKEEIERS